MSKYYDWNPEKNELLKLEREVCFEDVVDALEAKDVFDTYPHPNQHKYPGQKIVIVNIRDYAYLVPYVEDEVKIFFKTIIPSRKMTKRYIIK